MEAKVELVISGDRIRNSCTHERTCVGAANALTLTELARRTTVNSNQLKNVHAV